jgi:hypothetical protein
MLDEEAVDVNSVSPWLRGNETRRHSKSSLPQSLRMTYPAWILLSAERPTAWLGYFLRRGRRQREAEDLDR